MTFYDAPNQETVRPDGSGPGIMIETPTITSLAPNTAEVGAAMVLMIVTGTKFDPNTIIVWGGADEPTDYTSPTQVSTWVRPATASGPATVQVGVRNGNEPSPTTLPFTFTEPPPGGET